MEMWLTKVLRRRGTLSTGAAENQSPREARKPAIASLWAMASTASWSARSTVPVKYTPTVRKRRATPTSQLASRGRR